MLEFYIIHMIGFVMCIRIVMLMTIYECNFFMYTYYHLYFITGIVNILLDFTV